MFLVHVQSLGPPLGVFEVRLPVGQARVALVPVDDEPEMLCAPRGDSVQSVRFGPSHCPLSIALGHPGSIAECRQRPPLNKGSPFGSEERRTEPCLRCWRSPAPTGGTSYAEHRHARPYKEHFNPTLSILPDHCFERWACRERGTASITRWEFEGQRC